METGNKDKKIGIAAYECIGTAFIMYGVMMDGGNFASALPITFAMMVLAWNVSGGHFNPVLSIGMYVAEKDFGGNLVTLLIMIGSQFVGAILGILLGYLSLVDVTYQDDLADAKSVDQNASVPGKWVGTIAPKKPSGRGTSDDLGDDQDGFVRNWATFFMCLMVSMILTLSYTTIKSKTTKVHDDVLLNSAFVAILLSAVATLMARFGGYAALNPAIASAYIFFETTQYDTPNDQIAGYKLNHYLWAYFIGSMAGGAIGGFLHMVHSRCAEAKGRDNATREELIE